MPSDGERTDAERTDARPGPGSPDHGPEHSGPQHGTPENGTSEHQTPEHHGHLREAFEEVYDAAIAAEYETGVREETEEEARRGVIVRLARIIGGFTLIGIGIAGLALPGPGWLIIIIGLSLLPYSWAQRTIRLIRRRVPGIPEDGRIPTSTWIVMGGLVVGAAVISIVWGATIADFVSGLWGDPDKLLL